MENKLNIVNHHLKFQKVSLPSKRRSFNSRFTFYCFYKCWLARFPFQVNQTSTSKRPNSFHLRNRHGVLIQTEKSFAISSLFYAYSFSSDYIF